jgi:hypothetical protein
MEKKELDKAEKSNTIVYTISWNPVKSARLKRIRGVSFEEIIQSKFLGIEGNPSHSNQGIYVFEHKGYVWAVPFVYETDGGVFLKTIYPSRKFKKIYKGAKNEKDEIDQRRAVD